MVEHYYECVRVLVQRDGQAVHLDLPRRVDHLHTQLAHEARGTSVSDEEVHMAPSDLRAISSTLTAISSYSTHGHTAQRIAFRPAAAWPDMAPQRKKHNLGAQR